MFLSILSGLFLVIYSQSGKKVSVDGEYHLERQLLLQ